MIVGEKGGISYSDDEDIAGQFVTWTGEALQELRQLVDDMAVDAIRGGTEVMRVYDLVHNIKGMGASFDFQLMTAVGASLCGYIKPLDTEAAVSKRILDAHIRAFEVVYSNRITGDGGPQGAALTARLGAIIQEES